MISSSITEPVKERWSSGAKVMALALASLLVGVLLAYVGQLAGASGPAIVIGLPVIGVLAAIAFERPLIGIAAIIATFPFGTVSVPLDPIPVQVVEVSIIAVALIITFHRLTRGATLLPWTPQLWWILALVGWTLVALPSAVDQELALKQVAQLIGGLLYVTCVIAACRDMDDVRHLMTVLIVIAFGISIAVLLNNDQMQAVFGGTVVTGRAQGTFDQPNLLGSFAALAALVAVGLALGARRWKERTFFIGAVAVTTASLLLSLSRGAWIGTAMATLYLAVNLKRFRALIIGVALPLIGLAAIGGAFAPSNPQIQVITQRFESLTVRSPYDNRPTIWAEAIREIVDDPATGQGPGTFPVASARSSSESATASAEHAHNLWLTWAAESGIPAALLLTGFIVAIAAAVLRTARAAVQERDRTLVICMAAALIAILGQGTVDYTLRNAVVFFSVWTVVGTVLASWRILSSPTGSSPSAI